MSAMNCHCKWPCVGLAVVASAVLGILAAVFRFIGLIEVTAVFLWVAFGIAIVALGVAFVVAAFVRGADAKRCLCGTRSPVLAGILGTILTAVILLAFDFAATSVIGAVFTGGLVFFFSLLIAAVACSVKCLAACDG